MSEQRCKSGRACTNRTLDGPAATTRPLCEGCITDIQTRINQLPDYLNALQTLKGYKPAPVGQARVSGGSNEGSTPLNIAVIDLIDAIERTLTFIDGVAVRDLVTQVGGVECALSVRVVHMKAQAVCGLDRSWERRRAPCPGCGLPTLGGWLGEDRIQCTNSVCATTLSKDEYETYCMEAS